jgi:hypothetical protein
MAKSDFFCGRNAFLFGSRFCPAVLFSQVPKKCTDLDLSVLYNLKSGTYSKFARRNNFLSLCAWRSHRRAALLRTLRWLLKFAKIFVEGVRKIKSGSWNDEFSDNVILSNSKSRGVFLRSHSDFHVANLWEHSWIRSCLFNLIHLYCSKINQNDM